MLNYLYALLESETRLAVAVLGLDPGLGVLHMDAPARDSLAFDVMEPVRPMVDEYVLNWIDADAEARVVLRTARRLVPPDGSVCCATRPNVADLGERE